MWHRNFARGNAALKSMNVKHLLVCRRNVLLEQVHEMMTCTQSLFPDSVDEGLYGKLLSSLFNFWANFGCWWNTFQKTSFRAIVPSLNIHYEVCQFSARNRICSNKIFLDTESS